MIPAIILGRRHGEKRGDDPILIAGPTYAHGALVARFKQEFCTSSRTHPEFEEVWLYSMAEEKQMRFQPPQVIAKPESTFKGKKKQ